MKKACARCGRAIRGKGIRVADQTVGCECFAKMGDSSSVRQMVRALRRRRHPMEVSETWLKTRSPFERAHLWLWLFGEIVKRPKFMKDAKRNSL